MKTETPVRILEYGARRIPYQLLRSWRKRLRLVVLPNLEVRAHAPAWVSERDVHRAVKKKAHWIARHLDRFQAFHPLPVLPRYISGETFLYLGRQYRLKVEIGEPESAKLRGKFLCVSIADGQSGMSVKRAVEAWYRARAVDVFARYLDRCMEVASRHGVAPPPLVIRTMRTRWGSCSAAGRITLNLWLIQTPVHCIEYVVMHELCHLVHHNHSKAYYALLACCMPDWKERKHVLDRFSLSRCSVP